MKTISSLFILAILVVFTYGQFPTFIKLCKRDPNLNKCIKQNIEDAKKFMKNGIPKLFVHPTNPFIITEVAVETPLIKIQVSDFQVLGLDNFDVRNLNVDLDKNEIDIEFQYKYLSIESRYKLVGTLVGIDLNAEGLVKGNISDIGFVINLKGKPYEIENKTYLDLSNKSVKLIYNGEAVAHFENLFRYKELNEAANEIINVNMKDVIREAEPIILESFPMYFLNSINKVFQKFSLEELFPL